PAPLVTRDGDRYRLDHDRPQSVGKIREFLGNVQVVLKAYAWTRAMGAEGIAQASDISVLGNNYMEKGLLAIRGVTRSHPDGKLPRLEMTRYSLETMKEETGVGVHDVQNRMADFGIDPIWSSHEPWLVPEPFTPEAGEMYGKEALDRWIEVLAHISDEAYSTPELVKTSPHNQPTHRLKVGDTDDPSRRAMTWRASQKKRAQAAWVGQQAMPSQDGMASGKLDVPDLPAGADLQLVEDVAQMGLDRARAQEQLGTNLAVGRSRGDQPGDMQFLGGECVGGL